MKTIIKKISSNGEVKERIEMRSELSAKTNLFWYVLMQVFPGNPFNRENQNQILREIVAAQRGDSATYSYRGTTYYARLVS